VICSESGPRQAIHHASVWRVAASSPTLRPGDTRIANVFLARTLGVCSASLFCVSAATSVRTLIGHAKYL
jgi:hypothetical protein